MKEFTAEEKEKIQEKFNDAEKTGKVTIFEEGELQAIGVTDWLEAEKECEEALNEYVKNYNK